MKAERMVIVVAVLAAGYLLYRSSPKVQAKATGRHVSNGDGTTVDPQGNWWYRGQMIYQAPKQEWSI